MPQGSGLFEGCSGRDRRDVVCGVHFFATREDEERLLDVLGEPVVWW
jgi:hypothetical protein